MAPVLSLSDRSRVGTFELVDSTAVGLSSRNDFRCEGRRCKRPTTCLKPTGNKILPFIDRNLLLVNTVVLGKYGRNTHLESRSV